MDIHHAVAIDALFDDDVTAGGPGAAVGVYCRGELVFAKGYGLADLESERPITPRTPFHVASLSKQFTAFAIALLARDGHVDLDADVRDYLPYVPDFGARITLRHLLLHTSGLRNQITLMLLSGHGVENRTTQQQVLNLVTRQKTLNFEPGTDYSYSNTGYILLAEIVFAVTNQTLREFSTEQIFTPLGMRSTFFADDVTEIVAGRASSYTHRRDTFGQYTGTWARALLSYDNVGSSGLSTTVEDLAKWAHNLCDPSVGDPDLIEQISTKGTLDDGTPINYGLGLERRTLDGREALSHTGSDAAFRSMFAHYPEHDFTVAILANTELSLMSKVSSIADLYLPEPGHADQATLDEDTGADLSRYVGTYVPTHDTSRRLEIHDGSLLHRLGARDPQKLILRVDGTLDFGSPTGPPLIPVLDPTGQVTGLEAPRTGFGPPQHLQRFTPLEASPPDLAEYTGDYRSAELDVTYSIDAEDGGLTARHLWANRSTARLSQVLPDRFEFSGDRLKRQLKLVIVFQRDTEGQVTGFLLHTAGDRNIRFDQVDSASPPAPAASTRAQMTWG